MLGLPILDVAIGLIFTYLVLSLVVTTANELIASLLRRRQRVLWEGIQNLLTDEALATKLYEHPLIASLKKGKSRPSYIPSRTFVVALLDMVAPVTAQSVSTVSRLEQLRTTLAAQHVALPPSVTKTLIILLSEAGEDLEDFKGRMETWFNQSMDRVSGWYKRRTQAILLVLAILLTIGANADTLTIINTLWRDPAIRTAAVAQAESYLAQQQAASTQAAPEPAPPEGDVAQRRFQAALDQLHTLPAPMGWTPCPADKACSSVLDAWPGADRATWFVAIGNHWRGWLLTALAISLGAPFWFDLLSKVIAIRASGKTPAEKTAEESKRTREDQT